MAAERSIAVFGAGAVGGYLGSKLGQAIARSFRGRDHRATITLVGRPPMVDAVRARGLIVREGDLESVTHPGAVGSAVLAMDGRATPYDLVILTVRAYDASASIPDVRMLIGDRGLLLAMQNGVGSEEELAEALGRDRVLAGTLTVSAGMEEPGVVTRYSRQGGVALSTMDGSPIPAWILEVIRATELPTEIIADYRSLRWSKLLLNMLGAATTAILDVVTATLGENSSLFRLEQLAFREAGKVMDAQRIPTVRLPGYPVPLARLAMQLPRPLAQALVGPRLARARGGRAPTMRADMARGRSEMGFLNGAVVQAADRLGMRAPVNAALTALTEELVQHAERRTEFRERPKALLAYLAECGIRL